ncbi:armadillo-like helical domain-containing protein 2 [Sardina pilchardus]|uniref:armadillo-like helical domain-containing protein 2 n=1 Tax=Sardina pilchardus TaxID=27697 RepID=UPI002E15C794
MYQLVSKLYHKYIRGPLFGDVDQSGNFEGDNGKIRLHNNIREAGKQLQNEALPVRKRIEAAHSLGVFGYTGGYEAGKIAADFLPTLVQLLTEKWAELGDEHLTLLLEALSTVCYGHLSNQARACSLGLVAALPPMLTPAAPHGPKVQMWACYLLDVLCCSYVSTMRALEQQAGLQASLELLEAQDWTGWPRNYATVLLLVLGFRPVEPTEEHY